MTIFLLQGISVSDSSSPTRLANIYFRNTNQLSWAINSHQFSSTAFGFVSDSLYVKLNKKQILRRQCCPTGSASQPFRLLVSDSLRSKFLRRQFYLYLGASNENILNRKRSVPSFWKVSNSM